MGEISATRAPFKAAGLSRRDVQRNLARRKLTPMMMAHNAGVERACSYFYKKESHGTDLAVCVKTGSYTTGQVSRSAGRNFLDLNAFLCKSGRDCVDAMGAAQERVDSPVSFELYDLGNSLPISYYTGDLNGDGLMDVLVVLQNGRGVVFTQQKAK